MLDTPRAREVLFALLAEHLPSSRVHNLSIRVNQNGQSVLRDMEVFVRDLEDLAKLTDRIQEKETYESFHQPSRPVG